MTWALIDGTNGKYEYEANSIFTQNKINIPPRRPYDLGFDRWHKWEIRVRSQD